MKTPLLLAIFSTLLAYGTATAQVPLPTNTLDGTNAPLQAPPPSYSTPYSISARSEHTRTWARVTYRTNLTGRVSAITNLFTELQNGIAFRDPTTGQWMDSSDQIEIQPSGGAFAAKGPSQLYAPGSLYNDSLQCQMSNGQTI